MYLPISNLNSLSYLVSSCSLRVCITWLLYAARTTTKNDRSSIWMINSFHPILFPPLLLLILILLVILSLQTYHIYYPSPFCLFFSFFLFSFISLSSYSFSVLCSLLIYYLRLSLTRKRFIPTLPFTCEVCLHALTHSLLDTLHRLSPSPLFLSFPPFLLLPLPLILLVFPLSISLLLCIPIWHSHW